MLDGVPQLHHPGAPFLQRQCAPAGEGIAGGLQRLLGLFLGGQGYLSHRFTIAGAANLCGAAPAGYQLAVDILTKVVGWKGIHKFVPLFLAVNVDLGNGLVQLLLLLSG